MRKCNRCREWTRLEMDAIDVATCIYGAGEDAEWLLIRIRAAARKHRFVEHLWPLG